MSLNTQEYVDIHLKKLDNYIDAVLNNSIHAGKYERLAVERFLNFKQKYDYRQAELERCLKFFSLLNISFKGEVKQFEILDWQVFILANCYCFYYKDSNIRVINRAVISSAGKQGKSSLVTALSLLESVADNEINANVAIISLTQKQSNSILKYVKEMIQLSPLLSQLFKINHSTVYNKQKQQTNLITVVTNDSDNVQGLNLSAAILDEVFLYDNLDVLSIAQKKSSARLNPLLFVVGTFSNKSKPGYSELYEPCTKILEGITESDKTFIYFFQQDDIKEIEEAEKSGDYSIWRKSNPSLDVVQTIDDLKNTYEQVKLFPSSKSAFLSDSLNFFNESGTKQELWLEDDLVKSLMVNVEPIALQSTVYAGCDFSTNRDLTAISLLSEKDGVFTAKLINVMPNNPTAFVKEVDLANWFITDFQTYKDNNYVADKEINEHGYIIPLQTPTLDENFIVDLIIDLSNKFKIESLGYDAYNAGQIVYRLKQEGVYCNAVKQTIMHLNTPLKFIEKLIYEGRLKIEANACVRWQAKNIVLYRDVNNNVRFDKRNGLSIDAWAALLNSMHEYLAYNQSDLNLLISSMNK